jgi:hypothetical protein
MVIAMVAAGLLLARAEVGKKADAKPKLHALSQQVEQLQARLRSLEDRLAKLEFAKSQSAPRIQIVPSPPSAPPPIFIPSASGVLNWSGQQPKIWGQGEINGWPFYLIPCAGKSASGCPGTFHALPVSWTSHVRS